MYIKCFLHSFQVISLPPLTPATAGETIYPEALASFVQRHLMGNELSFNKRCWENWVFVWKK